MDRYLIGGFAVGSVTHPKKPFDRRGRALEQQLPSPRARVEVDLLDTPVCTGSDPTRVGPFRLRPPLGDVCESPCLGRRARAKKADLSSRLMMALTGKISGVNAPPECPRFAAGMRGLAQSGVRLVAGQLPACIHRGTLGAGMGLFISGRGRGTPLPATC